MDTKNVREFNNLLDVKDIGLQSKNSQYFNQLWILNKDYYDILEDDFLCNDAWDNCAAEILEQKYDRITAKQVAAEQHHLSEQQQKMLETTLEKYEILFDGKLGHCLHQKFRIDLVNDSKHVFKKACHVPFHRESLYKNVLQT